jgi:hypothetical protein
MKFIELYSPMLAKDGILVIEDVQSLSWIHHLRKSTPDHLRPFIEVFDLRENKNRIDDILFVINLSQPVKHN